jgi:NAD(P)-dependent dehydrogenase (short-subunit alcohol dehydrogenase family)
MATLSERVAIVTGGGRGIGRGIALALAGEGAAVVLAGRTLDPLTSTAAEIVARGGEATPIVCDVAESAQLAALVEATLAQYSRVDILVNNAAYVPHGELLSIADDVIDSAWRTGPLASLNLMKLCHPHLKVAGGSIINISSGASLDAASPHRGIYAATKAAVNSLSRTAAVEWGADGIRVNVVMPFGASDAVASFLANEPEYAQQVIAATPLRRVGDPEQDIGAVVAFLAGDAARFVTGTILPADGGRTYLR